MARRTASPTLHALLSRYEGFSLDKVTPGSNQVVYYSFTSEDWWCLRHFQKWNFRYNLHNIAAGIKVVRQMLNAKLWKEDEILILSPYKDQIRKYRIAFNKAGLYKIGICTTMAAQGREAECTIYDMMLSAKRSKRGIGYVKAPRQSNVGISRSRDCFILVCDTGALAKDNDWDNYVSSMPDSEEFLNVTLTWKFFLNSIHPLRQKQASLASTEVLGISIIAHFVYRSIIESREHLYTKNLPNTSIPYFCNKLPSTSWNQYVLGQRHMLSFLYSNAQLRARPQRRINRQTPPRILKFKPGYAMLRPPITSSNMYGEYTRAPNHGMTLPVWRRYASWSCRGHRFGFRERM